MNQNISLVDLLKIMDKEGASDLHLQVGSPPFFRINGQIVVRKEFPVIEEATLQEMIREALPTKDEGLLEERKSIDAALGVPELGRFRLNIFLQRGSPALVARRIASTIPDFESLNLPPSTARIAEFLNGLVLVTGPAGCGKSTTLAATINYINKKRTCHILCIEDPIEFLYKNDKALITQREVGVDVESFREALKYAVRQDPDVILIGEIRDEDTVKFALRASETGRLVLGTIHSADATQTIGRILNFFPPSEQPQIRKTLSLQLRAVFSQILVPSCKEGVGIVPACEIMFVTPTIMRLIAEGKDEKIIKAIKSGVKDGMQDFELALYDLIKKGFITKETGMCFADNPSSLEMKLKGIFLTEEGAILT